LERALTQIAGAWRGFFLRRAYQLLVGGELAFCDQRLEDDVQQLGRNVAQSRAQLLAREALAERGLGVGGGGPFERGGAPAPPRAGRGLAAPAAPTRGAPARRRPVWASRRGASAARHASTRLAPPRGARAGCARRRRLSPSRVEAPQLPAWDAAGVTSARAR